jgi:heat shock protein beta
MLPRYLNFVKGIVDSDNLPLNVSREILQQDRTLSLIKKKLTRKAIAMIQNLAEDKEKFDQFYEQYGTNLKYGVSGDPANRHRLSKLLRFYSSKTKALSSLDDYVGRMKEGQTQVLYVAGESQDVLARSPFVEKLIKRGYEVLFMTDPIDEWAVQNLGRFDNKWVMTDVSKEGFKLEGAEEEDEEKVREEEFQPLVDYLQEKLTGRIGKVVISSNLYRAPSAISSGAMGFTANMERLMKAQAFTNPQTLSQYKSTRILEINPKHSIILELNRRIQDPSLSSSPEEAILSQDVAELLYDSASLQSGFTVEDSAAFGARIFKLMKLSLDLSLEDEFADEELTNDESETETETETSDAETQDQSSEVEEEAEAAAAAPDDDSFSSQESSASAKDEL